MRCLSAPPLDLRRALRLPTQLCFLSQAAVKPGYPPNLVFSQGAPGSIVKLPQALVDFGDSLRGRCPSPGRRSLTCFAAGI
jgi:hypothetical protein